MTVAEYLTEWLATVVQPNLRWKSYQVYRWAVVGHIIPGLGNKPLAELVPLDIQRLLVAKRDEGLAQNSLAKIHGALKSALTTAEQWGLVETNAARKVSPLKAGMRRPKPLSRAEVRLLFAAVVGDRLEALYVLAVTVGMRQGELLGLSWDDVDLGCGKLFVRQQLQRQSGGPRLVPLKTKASRRVLNLPVLAIEALEAHRGRQSVERIQKGVGGPGGWAETGLVFVNRSGAPLDGQRVSKWFHGHLEAAGLEDRTFHALRHTCASLLVEDDVQPKIIQATLGHSSIQATMEIYAHVSTEVQVRAARAMDRLLTEGSERGTMGSD